MDSKEYIESLNTQFTYLFNFATKINEIDTAMAVFGEQRGMQDAGWNTTGTAYQVYEELTDVINKNRQLTLAEYRQTLCLYTHLSEAGGIYEGLQNLLNVPKLLALSMWPFMDMVRVRQTPRAVIGPNANAVFRRLATVAYDIGMPKLGELLENTFRDDIRNAIAHADYVIVPEGLRLPKRNGGNPSIVPNKDVQEAIEIAIFFFEALRAFQQDQLEKYRPAKEVIGKFSANPPMLHSLGYSETGTFLLETSSPGPHTDAAYDRQQLINDHLGGKMIAVFYRPGQSESAVISKAIKLAGFEALNVFLDQEYKFTNLLETVADNGLWDTSSNKEASTHSVLIVTPNGFGNVATPKEFQALLPEVEPIEFQEPEGRKPIEVKDPHTIYHSLMVDAKVRILNTERILEKQTKTGLLPLDAEFCYLQCRRVIEDITFGALIREHGRYADLRQENAKNKNQQNVDISNDWNAKAILKLLVQLSPHALPIPIEDPVEISPGHFHSERVEMEVNHNKLIELYSQAGGFLHGTNPLRGDYREIISLQLKRYGSANKHLEESIKFLKNLLWKHTAVTLEYSGKNPTVLESPKTAWILDFSPEGEQEIKMVLTEAKLDTQTQS